MGDVRLTVCKKIAVIIDEQEKFFAAVQRTRQKFFTENERGSRIFPRAAFALSARITFRQAPARRAVADFKNPQRRFQGNALTSRIEGIFYPEMHCLRQFV